LHVRGYPCEIEGDLSGLLVGTIRKACTLQVVSGLVKHIALEDMQGRRVVIVANLKAGNMRGVRSEAMVLAASSADGLQVPPPSPVALAKC